MFLLSLSLIWNCWFYFQGATMHLMTVVSCSSAKGLERPSHHSHFDMSYQIQGPIIAYESFMLIMMCAFAHDVSKEKASSV